MNPAGLLAGTYSGVILIATSSGTTGSSQNVAVTLTISDLPPSPMTVPTPIISSLVNGASLLLGPIAPGEIISFFGRGLGPLEGAVFRIAPGGVWLTIRSPVSG